MKRAGRTIVASLSMAGLLAGAGAGAGCGPLPGDGPRTAPPPPDRAREVVTIRTDDPTYFYLVDTRRGLCFFGDRRRPQLTRVACEELPEARELLGLVADPADPHAPHGDVPPAPAAGPPDPPAPVAETDPEPEPELPPAAPPTAEERDAFSAAYVEVFCAYRRSGAEDAGPPDESEIAERHGLTPERYDEVRTAVAADAAAWAELTRKAMEACR